VTNPVRLRVVTTSSHNPEGCDFHIRNLKWATDDAPIYLQTVKGYPENISDGLEVDYVHALHHNRPEDYARWRPGGYFRFYNPMARMDFSDVDVVLFMQQDIILTEKVLELAKLCRDTGTIVVNFCMHLHNTLYWRACCPGPNCHKRDGEVFYPRVWEGATLLPARLVREAIQENVAFDHRFQSLSEGSWLYEASLKELSDCVISSEHPTVNGPGRVELKEFFQHILSRGYDEIMFELMLYAVHKRIPYFLLSQNSAASPYAVHLCGIDPAYRASKGELYHNLSVIDSIKKRRVEQFKGNIAFMCLMNGTAPQDNKTAKYLATGPSVFAVTAALAKYGAQWMTGVELGNLSWAREEICKAASAKRPPGIHQNIRGKLPSK
jgi:hypothetical protein